MGLFDSALTSDNSTCGQEGFLSSPQDTRSTGEYGRGGTLLHYRLQKWILAGPYGPGVTAVYRVHGQQPRIYEFTRMPLGCVTHLMQNTLGELNLTYCIIYLDDVIVYSHTKEEHLERLRIVLECFQEFNLKLKPSKCSFFQSQIVYLTHHVSKEGICLSDENI